MNEHTPHDVQLLRDNLDLLEYTEPEDRFLLDAYVALVVPYLESCLKFDN